MDDARKVLEAMDAPPGEYMAVKKRLGWLWNGWTQRR